MRSAVLLVAGASACIWFGAPVAHADAPVDEGWWTVSNPGSPAPAQRPPDVPPDGLLIQGGSTDTPVAFAGLIYEPEAGATAKQLVLKVHSPSATTPGAALKLCLLTSPKLNAEQGGPIADAPAYNCAHSVTAAPSTDASSYTFNLGALGAAGPFGVAVLPTAPDDRVVLAKPGADSLGTSTPSSTFSPAAFPTEPATTPQREAPFAESLAIGAEPLRGIGPAPAAVPQPSVGALASTSAPVLASAPTLARAASSGKHHAAVRAGLLALLAVACGLWAFAGHSPARDEASTSSSTP